jgi:hypothetical protein
VETPEAAPVIYQRESEGSGSVERYGFSVERKIQVFFHGGNGTPEETHVGAQLQGCRETGKVEVRFRVKAVLGV